MRAEEHTININDGTLTIIGNSHAGVVYADYGGTLNFRGNGDLIIENIGSSNAQNDPVYGNVEGNRLEAETVYSYGSFGDTAINFYNPNTLIRGTNYSAIRAESRNGGGIASVYFQNNLQIDLNRQTEDNFKDSNVYAVYLNDGHLRVDGTANISVKANPFDNLAMGMWMNDSKLEGARGQATFNGDTTFTIDGGGAVYGYGIYVQDEAGVTFARGAQISVNNTNDATGLRVYGNNSNVTAGGNLTVSAIGMSSAYGIRVQDASVSAASANITAHAANARGIYAANATATFSGHVSIDAPIAAHARGAGTEVAFNDGLSNVGETTMKAEEGASILVSNVVGSGLVQYTGTTDITGEYADGAIDMTLNGTSSYWRVTGDSRATKLTNSGALLDMTADGGAFSTLTLADLGGENGVIRMDIDASTNADNSDKIFVSDTFSGTQTVDLHRTDGNGEPVAAGTVLAKVNNNEGTFIADDTEGTLFYNRYTLDKQATDEQGYTTEWYIKEIEHIGPEPEPDPEPGPEPDDPAVPEAPRETTTVNSVMSAASLNYHTWRTQNDKLMQRMGDLRKGGGANNGAWFRFGGSKISLGGGHGFDNEYMYYEVGYDRIIRETSKYTWFGGVAFSYGEGDSSYARGDGDNESKAVSLYLTQINKGGSYLDLVFKLGRWDDDFAVRDSYGERITGETENTGISFSAEYGKKIALNKNGFYIEPQAQLTYGHLDGDTYTTSNGVSVHQEGIESLVGRFGFNLGWDISETSNIYLKASVLHEFLGDYGVSMSDATGRVRLSGDYGDTWFEYGLGAAFTLGKPNSANFLYFDVERSEGGDLDMEWRWNAGFRFEM